MTVDVEPISRGFLVRPFPGLVQPMIDMRGFHHIAVAIPVERLWFYRCHTGHRMTPRRERLIVCSPSSDPRAEPSKLGRMLARVFPDASIGVLFEPHAKVSRVTPAAPLNSIDEEGTVAAAAMLLNPDNLPKPAPRTFRVDERLYTARIELDERSTSVWVRRHDPAPNA